MNAGTLFITRIAVLALSALSCKRAPTTSPPPAPPAIPTPPAAPDAPEPVIFGKVIDNFGRVIAGATVSIRDTLFRATTDAEGDFSLAFAPGSFHLSVAAPGCVAKDRDLQVTQAVRYPLGPTMLVRVPNAPPEDVVVATEEGYRPFPSVELDRRVVNFGSVYAAFPGRCAVFTLDRPLRTLRGMTLFVVAPDTHYRLVRVVNQHVTTDPYPGSVGECPGVPQGSQGVETRSGTMPSRTFSVARELAAGTYCLIRSPRVHPEASESNRAHCFEWQADPTRQFGATMTEPELETGAPPEQLGDMSDHGA